MMHKKTRVIRPETETFPLRLDKTLIARIRLKAERERRTMANWIRMILENAVRRGV